MASIRLLCQVLRFTPSETPQDTSSGGQGHDGPVCTSRPKGGHHAKRPRTPDGGQQRGERETGAAQPTCSDGCRLPVPLGALEERGGRLADRRSLRGTSRLRQAARIRLPALSSERGLLSCCHPPKSSSLHPAPITPDPQELDTMD